MRPLVRILALAVAAGASAQVPGKLGYQGRILRADGTAETGVVNVTFAVYDAQTGGFALGCDQAQVALSDGFYSIHLGGLGGCTGSSTPIDVALFDGRDLYLELAVAGAALSPRQRIASVPYAIRAGTAVNVRGGTVEATSITAGGPTGFSLSASGLSVGTTNVLDASGTVTAASGALTQTSGDGRYVLKAGDLVTGRLEVQGGFVAGTPAGTGGAVGVGTTSPASSIHVVDASGTTGRAMIRADATTENAYLVLNANAAGANAGSLLVKRGDTGLLKLNNVNDSGQNHLVITPAGDIGVGTATPGARLEVAGAARLTGDMTARGGSTAATGRRGLAGEWKFENGAADTSGNARHGVIAGGAAGAPGVVGGGTALEFDGVDDVVTVPDSPGLNPTAAITVTAWVWTTPGTEPDNRSVVYKISGNNGYRLHKNNGNNSVVLQIPNPATGAYCNPAEPVMPAGSWVHAAGTFDGTTLRSYYNGQQVAAGPCGFATIGASNAPLTIGSGAGLFRGFVDDVRIYDRALSAAEIDAEFQGSVRRTVALAISGFGAQQPLVAVGGNGPSTNYCNAVSFSVPATANYVLHGRWNIVTGDGAACRYVCCSLKVDGTYLGVVGDGNDGLLNINNTSTGSYATGYQFGVRNLAGGAHTLQWECRYENCGSLTVQCQRSQVLVYGPF